MSRFRWESDVKGWSASVQRTRERETEMQEDSFRLVLFYSIHNHDTDLYTCPTANSWLTKNQCELHGLTNQQHTSLWPASAADDYSCLISFSIAGSCSLLNRAFLPNLDT
jgi:hypothetical protein